MYQLSCRLSQRHRRFLVGVVLSTLLLVGMGGATVGVGAQQDLTNSSDTTRSELPPHQNPDEIETGSDLAQLESLLRGSLDGQLSASMANLDEDDYEQARQLLGEEYNGDLSRYRELAEDLDRTEQAELFRSVRSNQEEYISAVEAYEETRQEYEQARRDGDDERARRLARNLSTTANELNSDGGDLSKTYQNIQRESGQNYSERVEGIETRRTEAIDTAQRAAESEFTKTTLSATANQSTVAFTESLLISGEILTADGEPLETNQARIVVQNQSYTVDLNRDSEFEQTVRPEGVWKTESDNLQVRYDPAQSSEYLGSRTNLSVGVDATETTVEIESVSDPVGYDVPLTVNGTVTATETGKPVPAAPVGLRLGGRQIITTETTTDGRFSIQRNISAAVSSGPAVARVSILSSPLALQQSSTDAEIEIEPTRAVVTVDPTVVETTDGASAIQVRGSLDSAGGRPVPATPVTIRIDGTEVGVTETDRDGRFTERFAVPDDAAPGELVIVEAGFAGQGSNLQSATSSTTVELPETLLESVGDIPSPAVLLGVLVLVSGVSLGAVGWWLRQQSTDSPPSTAESIEQPQAESTHNRELLGAAADSLADGAHESAATLAYAAVRRQLAPEVDVGETATHWEWYQACATAGVDQLSEVETLVQAFETVAFAPDNSETSAAASRAVSTARQFVDGDQ